MCTAPRLSTVHGEWRRQHRDPHSFKKRNSHQPDDNTIITVGATDGFGLWEHDRNTESRDSAFDHTRASLIEVWHGERDDCNVWFGAAVDGKAGYIWRFPRSGRTHGDFADEKFKDADVDTVLDKLNEIRKAEPANR